MSSELVTVATFGDSVTATMARNHLENGGISAFLLDENELATEMGVASARSGIMLQVNAESAAAARRLLHELPDEEAGDAPPVPETAIAAPAVAATLKTTSEEISLKDQEADRLFRAAVVGLIFVPVQGYALWQLMVVLGTAGKLSSRRRWKVLAAVLFNFPLMAMLVVPLVFLASYLTGWHTGVSWRQMVFHDAGFSVRFPREPDRRSGTMDTGFGRAEIETFGSEVESATYVVHVTFYPAAARDADPEQLLSDEAPAIAMRGGGKLLWQKKIDLEGTPGLEFLVELPQHNQTSREHAIARSRFYFAGGRLYTVETVRWGQRGVPPPEIPRFLDSFALR
jgi:hypothetical protein